MAELELEHGCRESVEGTKLKSNNTKSSNPLQGKFWTLITTV